MMETKLHQGAVSNGISDLLFRWKAELRINAMLAVDRGTERVKDSVKKKALKKGSTMLPMEQ